MNDRISIVLTLSLTLTALSFMVSDCTPALPYSTKLDMYMAGAGRYLYSMTAAVCLLPRAYPNCCGISFAGNLDTDQSFNLEDDSGVCQGDAVIAIEDANLLLFLAYSICWVSFNVIMFSEIKLILRRTREISYRHWDNGKLTRSNSTFMIKACLPIGRVMPQREAGCCGYCGESNGNNELREVYTYAPRLTEGNVVLLQDVPGDGIEGEADEEDMKLGAVGMGDNSHTAATHKTMRVGLKNKSLRATEVVKTMV